MTVFEEQENSLDKQTLSKEQQEASMSLTNRGFKELPTSVEKLEIVLNPASKIWKTLKENILLRGTTPKYPIGLKALDDILWGLHKQEILVIGGRPGQGKSCLAIHMTRRLVEQKQRVIFFSLEMSKEQLLERLLCNVCRIDGTDLRRGRAKDRVDEAESVFLDWLSLTKLLIDDRYGYSFENIVKVCDIIHPDFIILDYIQMISIKGFRSKLDAIEEYVRKIKELSKINNFGVILISQINRGGADNPTMDKLKHAGVLEEHPENVLTLNWKYEDGRYKYEASVEKQRHGETGKAELRFLPRFSSFEDIRETSDEIGIKRQDLE